MDHAFHMQSFSFPWNESLSTHNSCQGRKDRQRQSVPQHRVFKRDIAALFVFARIAYCKMGRLGTTRETVVASRAQIEA